MNIFTETNYRKLIRQMVQERKRNGDSLTLESLAKSANMQKAHLTNILNGRANIQNDQMYLMSKFLKLNEDETYYLELLIEFERSVVLGRKKRIGDEILKLQRKYLRTESHLNHSNSEKSGGIDKTFPEYYLEPLHQLVHVGLSIEKFSVEPRLLATQLRITEDKLENILSNLVRHGITEKIGGRFYNIQKSLHLKKDSPLYRPWRSQLTDLGQLLLDEREDWPHYGFTVVFSADIGFAKKLQAQILEFIKNMEEPVKRADSKNLFQFSVDLGTWC